MLWSRVHVFQYAIRAVGCTCYSLDARVLVLFCPVDYARVLVLFCPAEYARVLVLFVLLNMHVS
jgi:hypothetical protein